jgi:hypothetical protein
VKEHCDEKTAFNKRGWKPVQIPSLRHRKSHAAGNRKEKAPRAARLGLLKEEKELTKATKVSGTFSARALMMIDDDEDAEKVPDTFFVFLSSSSRGDWTPLELFLAGVRGKPACGGGG